MTSSGAGQAPLRSRWSDSTLSTAVDTAASTPISPHDDADASVPVRGAPRPRRGPPSPIHEDSSADGHADPRHTPRPLRKSTTSSSQRSGEITIMLDPGIPALPRPKSTSHLTPRAPLHLEPSPILRVPAESGLPPASPAKDELKSRFFSDDRTASPALRSPSSRIPPPPSPSSLTVSSQSARRRTGSDSGQHAPPSAPRTPSYIPGPRRPLDLSAPLSPPSLHPASAIPLTSSSSTLAPRHRSASELSQLHPSQRSSPMPFASAPTTHSVHSRPRSGSNVGASLVPSAMSSLSTRQRSPSGPPGLMTPSAVLRAPAPSSPGVSAFSSTPPRHSRNQSAVSLMSRPDEARYASSLPPPLPSPSRNTVSSGPGSPRITKSRLQSMLPPPPPPPAVAQAGSSAFRSSMGSTKSKSGSLLGRLGTLSRLGRADPSRYQKLDEERDEPIRMEELHGQADEAPLGVDISSFEGPQSRPRDESGTHPALRRNQTHHRRTSDDDILEAKGHLTGGLGVGMTSVVTKTLHYPDAPLKTPARRMTWRKGPSPSPFGQTQVGQQTAEFEGTVIAVEEEDVGVDLSNVEGRQHSAGVQNELDFIAEDPSKQSYYFPPDPQMPDWRPVTMRPWYIVVLIALALTFTAVVETLCQMSYKRSLEVPASSLLTFTNPDQVGTGDWFVWKYLPEAIFVTYGVLFQATDFEVRRLEPYYQMSKPTGAKAEESLNLDYLTFWSYLIPFKAYRYRQWAVLQSSIATILSSAVIPVLFSAALNMDPDRDQRLIPNTTKYVRMDLVWSRVTEAALLVVAVVGTLLLIQLRRKSGLVSDPKGIAGIAAMATKSHILTDFRGLDMASHQTIHKHLAHRRYILHKTSLWQGEYITRTNTEALESKKPGNPHPMALHIYFGLSFIAFLVFFLVFIPIVEFKKTVNIVTDKAPWFLTLLATLIKLAWTNLETGVRMTEPFYVLSQRHAPPRVLLLDYTGTIPGYMPLKAALNRHFVLAAVGVGSILCEVLTVVISSFNIDGWLAINGEENDGETQRSYVASFALAEIIPVFLVAILVLVYLRRRHPFLPRQPGTIASVLAFLAQSKMLYDFVAPEIDDEDDDSGLSAPPGRPPTQAARSNLDALVAHVKGAPEGARLDVAQQTVRVLEQRGKTYGLGWYRGRDGTDHLGVDEEELLADYHHGMDWSKGRMGVHDIGRWETL